MQTPLKLERSTLWKPGTLPRKKKARPSRLGTCYARTHRGRAFGATLHRVIANVRTVRGKTNTPVSRALETPAGRTLLNQRTSARRLACAKSSTQADSKIL